MFQPGESGNPSGRPKNGNPVQRLAKERCIEAIEKLFALLSSKNEKIALQAAQAIIDRGYGKPAQSVTLSGDEDHPLQLKRIVEYARTAKPNGSATHPDPGEV